MKNDIDELQKLVEKKIQEAQDLIQSDIKDGFSIDRMDAECTTLMSNVGLVRSKYENRANTWKMLYSSLQEIVRSLRRMHESINTERRMGG
jgi:DNA repair ATPase RecN